ncbi:MAG: fused MFS/spermidine synthase [Nitrospirota bacterium]
MLKIIIAVLSFLMIPLNNAMGIEKILYQKDSLYQHIVVLEDAVKRERFYYSNKREGVQGGIYMDAPERLLFEYARISFVSLAFLDRDPKDVLFIGLGSGSMPQYFNRYYPEANIDIVELDPEIVDIAKRYFYFKEGRNMKMHTTDGRVFIKRTPKRYDVIFLDAYQGGDIPFHLTTIEFLMEVKGRLKEGGVVVSNILSQFRNRFFDSMVATYDKAFPHFYIFKGRKSNNFIFIATKSSIMKEKEEIYQRARKIKVSKKMDIDLQGISWTCEYCDEYRTDAKVLTDDFAPVNLYRHMKVYD